MALHGYRRPAGFIDNLGTFGKHCLCRQGFEADELRSVGTLVIG